MSKRRKWVFLLQSVKQSKEDEAIKTSSQVLEVLDFNVVEDNILLFTISNTNTVTSVKADALAVH